MRFATRCDRRAMATLRNRSRMPCGHLDRAASCGKDGFRYLAGRSGRNARARSARVRDIGPRPSRPHHAKRVKLKLSTTSVRTRLAISFGALGALVLLVSGLSLKAL